MTALSSPLASVLLVSLAASLPAQLYGDGRDGVLQPTTDITLDTTANGGVFQFTSIAIPAGVTVHLTGSNPAQILCQGTVLVAGTLEADARGSAWTFTGPSVHTGYSSQAPGPGGFAGGDYLHVGAGPGGGSLSTCLLPIAGGNASHATQPAPYMCYAQPPVYGAALPFDLRGGSGGAGSQSIGSQTQAGPPASGGGGVIVLLAAGQITVTGTISARGGNISMTGLFTYPTGVGGCGSGGSILLRSLQCVRVSGRVDARGGELTPNVNFNSPAGDGFIRIDAYSACGAPDLSGATVLPAAYVTALPWLTELEPARIGLTYRVRCASAPGDVLGLYLSFGRSSLAMPPFGVVELDPTFILDLGQYTVPASGHDPLAAADIMIPNVAALVGLTAYSQMFNAFGTVTGQARLSNLLVTTIGS